MRQSRHQNHGHHPQRALQYEEKRPQSGTVGACGAKDGINRNGFEKQSMDLWTVDSGQ
jgi:hypothetical protein